MNQTVTVNGQDLFLSASLAVGKTAGGALVPLLCASDGTLSTAGGGGGGAGSDRELVISTYQVVTAFSGASVGDVLTETQILNVTTNTPTHEAVVWRNQTTNADLGSAPSAANIAVIGKGASTEATLLSILGRLPPSATTIPGENDPGQPVRVVPSDLWRVGFAPSGSGVVSSGMSALATGAGMSVSQAQSNLLITSGTTVNAETLIMSSRTFQSGIVARAKLGLSQRIANQCFGVWLADLVGTGLAYTTDGTGQNITVTIPSNPFTSANIGQGVNLGAISGTGVPGRYVISAVSGNNITFNAITACTWTRSTTTATISPVGGGTSDIFTGQTGAVTSSSDTAAIVNGAVTVASSTGGTFTFTCLNAGATSGTLIYQNTSQVFAANASGTLTLWGWNALHWILRDVSATAACIDSQRFGWGAVDTVVTTTSTASGNIFQIQTDGSLVDFADVAPGSSSTYSWNSRGTRIENIPETDTPLYLFIQAKNSTAAPASTTTFTIGFVGVEMVGNQKVTVMGAQGMASRAITVQIVGSASLTVSQGTGSNLNAQVTGAAAHSAAASQNPVRIASKTITSIDTSLVNNDACDLFSDTNGSVAMMPYGVSAGNINIVAPAGGTITNSTAPVTVHAAPAAGVRNFYTAIQLNTDALSAATELVLRDVALTCASQTIAANTLTTSTAHGLSVGDAIVASASTVAGLTAGVTYYVLTAPSTTTITLSSTRGGGTLAISGTGVTATLNHILWRAKLQTSGIAVPAQIPVPSPLRGGVAVAQELVTLTAATGSVYFSAQGYQSA